MDLRSANLAAPYRRILDTCEPFLITYPGNHSALDLAPFGLVLRRERLYTATSLTSRNVVDGLHVLDAATFGDQEMLMPRWVLFDCGEFPGIVFGFGRRAEELSPALRSRYRAEDDDSFVPLSMWVAIRCAEEGSWFGHNLSSVNVMATGDDALPGLATLTKAVGVKVARATRQYGATQWTSSSIGLHLRLGDMQLLSAYTPAHTHPETLSYRMNVDEAVLTRSLLDGYRPSRAEGDRRLAADDRDTLLALQSELEAGDAWTLVRAESVAGSAQRLHLVRGSAT
ncbi:MAG: hypothetical protein FJ095_11110 [Deltaproteobacteria bacterium]|nr:hypothetical protein [Deltaproteobacteria bacterium]